MIGAAVTAADDQILIGRIPIKNIWLLFAYAADLAHLYSQHAVGSEDAPTVSDLVARLLNVAMEHRLRRTLNRSYQRRSAVLTRVRGRIDIFNTFTRDLPSRGEVACSFEDYTLDTPRNRYVHAALCAVAPHVTDPDVAHHTRTLALRLGRLGVSNIRPARADISRDRLGRNDRDDQMMLALATFVFDMLIPAVQGIDRKSPQTDQSEQIVRKLFEKAVGNFYASELLAREGWAVRTSRRLYWPLEDNSQGLPDVLPSMEADIVIDHKPTMRRLIVDTKFTGIFTRSQHKERILKSGYLYQIYAYVRSQESADDPASLTASGLLLHPSIGSDVDEIALIQGHRFLFSTVDLSADSTVILQRLREIAQTAV